MTGRLLRRFSEIPGPIGTSFSITFWTVVLALVLCCFAKCLSTICRALEVFLEKFVEKFMDREYEQIASYVFENLQRLALFIHGGSKAKKKDFKDSFTTWRREGDLPAITSGIEMLQAAIIDSVRRLPQRLALRAMPKVAWVGVMMLGVRHDYKGVRIGWLRYCGRLSHRMRSAERLTVRRFASAWKGTPAGPPTRPVIPKRPWWREILMVPNILSATRLVGGPWLALAIGRDGFAPVYALLFLALCLTDTFDGRLARTLGQETRIGQLLDPTADRFLLIPLYFALLTGRGIDLPFAVGAVVALSLAREVILSVLMIFRTARKRGITDSVHWTGKAATMINMAGLCALLLRGEPGLLFGCAVASVLAVGSVFSAVALSRYFNPQVTR